MTMDAAAAVPRAIRVVRFGLAVGWAGFAAWLFVYAMPLSGVHAALGVWALWPAGARSRGRHLAAIGVFLAGFVTVPLLGLPEYAATTNALHCRVLGFTGARTPDDCDAAEVRRGAASAASNGPLFSARERLGIHGFNLLLSLGGRLVGLPEVAAETTALSFTADPLPPDATTSARRAQCRASYRDRVSGALGAPRVVDSDFPMRSARVRRAIAAGVPRLRHAPNASRDLGEIHFVHGTSDFEAYGGALLGDSARVALALEVGDSRLKLTRGADDRIEVTWTGTIHYPGDDAAFEAPMPLPWGPRVLRVSETVFCGMHADGAMNPYSQTYRWTIREDDPRLGPARDRSDRGLGERLAVALVSAGS